MTIEAQAPTRGDEAQALADRLGGQFGQGRPAVDELRIVLLERGAELWDHASRRHGMPIGWATLDLRTGAGNLSRKQPLAKAIGKQATTIVDATGGFGHDAALLACMGWHVHCIERHRLLAALLEMALADAYERPELAGALGNRLVVQHGDASDLLHKIDPPPDVVYLDPMFEPRKGSALPKKPAQLLQRITSGAYDNASELLAVARDVAHRVAVKRPADGPPLAPDPDLSFAGRLVRYDVYLQPIHS